MIISVIEKHCFLHIELMLATNVCLLFDMNETKVQYLHVSTRTSVVDRCQMVQLYKTQHTAHTCSNASGI